MRVFAHDEVREERHGLADARQVVERAHGHVDLVSHAGGHHDELGRILLRELARDAAEHESLPRFTRRPRVTMAPRPSPPWAWQMAHASASAASGLGTPGSLSNRFTISWTCSF